MDSLQKKLSFLPDYDFKATEEGEENIENTETKGQWPAVNSGTTASGIIGGGIVLLLVALIGFALNRRRKS